MNPDRYAVIYNSKYDCNDSVFDSNSRDNTVAAAISSSTSSISIKTNQNYYYTEYHEGLVELAKRFLNLLLN